MSTVEKCVTLLNTLSEAQILQVLGYIEDIRSQNNAEYTTMLDESEAEIRRGEVFTYTNGQFS